jgi:hypothetical protein
MLAVRHGIGGGLLYLADYDVYLAVPHGSISIFDGQSVLHGVTPFTITSHDAWRYTLVAYAKTGMKPNRMWTITNMLRRASKATGKTYKRTEALKAAADLEILINS